MMKSNSLYRSVVLLVIISLCLILFSGCSGFKNSPDVTNSEIVVKNYSPSISNTRIVSYTAPQMAYNNGKLYICYLSNPSWNDLAPWDKLVAKLFYNYEGYSHKLVCIENGEITTICEAKELLGSFENYIYFTSMGTLQNDFHISICVYNTQTNVVTELVTALENKMFFEYDFTSAGILRVKVSSEENTAYHIQGDNFLGSFPADLSSYTIHLAGSTYTIKHKRDVYCNDEDINDQFPAGPYRSFHPIGDGVVVQTEDAEDGQFACYINSNGEIISLIPEMDCEIIHSSLSVYGDYIFLSFYRMQYNNLLLDMPTSYKNDALSGTYRIDIRDFSRTKISDQCFDSMFIFDDTGIFGNNGSGTYKIDFDGNPLLTIIEG